MYKLTASDDGAIMNQVQATHAPHGRQIVVDPLIDITDQILVQAIACSTGDVHGKEERSETSKKATKLDRNDTSMIQKLSRELSSYKRRCVHAKTMELLNALSSYQWHAKVVLVLTGFAINFGEFCYLVQPYPTSTLSMSIALLIKLPNIGDKSSFLKRRLDILNKLVKATLDVSKCMAEVMNLQLHYISEDKQAESIDSSLVPNAAYLTIKSIVSCSWQIASIMNFRQEYISPSREALELSNLVSEVNSMHQKLKDQLDKCYRNIGEEIIRQSLRYSEDDLQIDTIGSNETRVNVESQRKKHVLLLISDLNIADEEIQVLDKLYKQQAMQSDERLYEMVWIPVVKNRRWTYLNQCKFGELKSIMPWHSVRYSVIDPASVVEIKEKLNFTGKPILLVRDPQGRVTSTNVIHLMWIWGNLAFPFTREREEDLWSNQIWSLRTLIDPIDATILEWISEDNHICLYGGSNLEWIRTLTKTMTSVARAAKIKLKMAYVGEHDAKEETQKIAAAIAKENLSYVLPNNLSLWLFWARLESMQYSKSQQNKTENNDEFMRELTTLLNYDGDEGWAMICGGGSGEMARDSGPNILRALERFKYWEDDVVTKGFEMALKEYLGKLPSASLHCHNLILPFQESLKGIVVRSSEGRLMEKEILFLCSKE